MNLRRTTNLKVAYRVKDKSSNLLAGSDNILYHCCTWLLKVHGVNDIRQAEMHTAETLVPEPSSFDIEIVMLLLTNLNGIDHTPQTCFKKEVKHHVLRSTNILILLGIVKKCHSSGKSLVITGEYHL
jgi:hypothetical protein